MNSMISFVSENSFLSSSQKLRIPFDQKKNKTNENISLPTFSTIMENVNYYNVFHAENTEQRIEITVAKWD